MRKLLLFFAMLCVSVGTWAQGTVVGDNAAYLSSATWHLDNTENVVENVVRIKIQKPGSLAEAITAYMADDNLKGAQKVHISITDNNSVGLNSADIAALSNLTVATIDLQDAFYTVDGVKTAFTFTNSSVRNLILPDNWTKAEVTAACQAIIATPNSDFGSGFSIGQDANSAITETKDVTHYYYEGTENEFTGEKKQEGEQWKGKVITMVNRDLRLVETSQVWTNNFNNQTYPVGDLTVTDNRVIPATYEVSLAPEWYDNGNRWYGTPTGKNENGYYYKYWDGDSEHYLTVNWKYDNNSKTYTGDVTDNGDGTFTGVITNTDNVSFPVTTNYTYTYTDLDDNQQTVTYNEQKSQIALEEVEWVNLDEVTKQETSVIGKSLHAYVNKGNTLFDAINRIYDDEHGDTKLISGNIYNRYTHACSAVKALSITGNPAARDFNGASKDNGLRFTSDGHLKFNVEADENKYGTNDVNAGVGGVARTLVGNGDATDLTSVDGAIKGAALIVLDLGDAVITEENNADLTLSWSYALGNQTKQVIIPTSSEVETLPADFLNISGVGVRQICIPGNIKYIKTRAFQQVNLYHVWTTGSNEDIRYDNGVITGFDAEKNPITEYGQLPLTAETPKYGTITLPSGLKLIESGAFQYSTHCKDLYVLSIEAPECHVDAFSTVMYVANDAFDQDEVAREGIISREAYRNNPTDYTWMTLLHYPRECTTPQVQRYTDPTRDYSVATGMRDGKGATIYFPNQSEYYRAYFQGTFGYLWNSWDTTRDGNFAVSTPSLSATAGHTQQNGQQKSNDLFNANTDTEGKQYTAFYDVTLGDAGTSTLSHPSNLEYYYNVYWDESSYSTSGTESQHLYPEGKDYRGWHQFVLTAYAHNKKDDIMPYRSYITDNEWWTICMAFDLTKSEIEKIYGGNGLPYVSKLTHVVRDIKNERITLMFSNNLMEYKETVDEGKVHGVISTTKGGVGDDDVVIHKGVPYLIRPNLKDDATRQFDITPSERLYEKLKTEASLTGDEQKALIYAGEYTVPSFVVNNEDGLEGVESEAVDFTMGDGTSFSYAPGTIKYFGQNVPYKVSSETTYTFVGSLYKSPMPANCYFLGWDSRLNGGKGGAAFWYNKKQDEQDWNWNNETGIIIPNFNTDTEIHAATTSKDPARWIITGLTGDDIKTSTGSGAKKYSMEFGAEMSGVITGVEGLSEESNISEDQTVYNIQGAEVGRSLRGLSKGVYIMNGKKYVVK